MTGCLSCPRRSVCGEIGYKQRFSCLVLPVAGTNAPPQPKKEKHCPWGQEGRVSSPLPGNWDGGLCTGSPGALNSECGTSLPGSRKQTNETNKRGRGADSANAANGPLVRWPSVARRQDACADMPCELLARSGRGLRALRSTGPPLGLGMISRAGGFWMLKLWLEDAGCKLGWLDASCKGKPLPPRKRIDAAISQQLLRARFLLPSAFQGQVPAHSCPVVSFVRSFVRSLGQLAQGCVQPRRSHATHCPK